MDEELEGGLDVERTRLANERTFLAWWRTGLAAVAAGFALGRLLPSAIAGTTAWPYIVLGVLLAAAGVGATIYGTIRFRATEEAIARGQGFTSSGRALVILAATGVAAGVFAVVFIAFSV